jgi:hypothetical protein
VSYPRKVGRKMMHACLLLAATGATPWLATAAAEEAAIAVSTPGPPQDPHVENGRRMYMEGRLPSGELMSGTVVGDVKLSGEQVICVACHRRSGLGSTEGQEAVPAVTGDLLYEPLRLPTSKPPLAPILRPAYDDESLKRVIREGVRSDGKPLGVLMPRYSLTDEQLDDLIAYLKSLESSPAPGVTEQDIHFATIIAGAVEPQARKAFLDVIETYFEQKNRESRHESDRSAHAPWHKAWVMKPYRKWVLHLWNLEGPPESWPGQLAAKYQEQPVFAVISGLGSGSWEPIHGFCEKYRVPCILPITDLPVVDETDFYSIYFTRGMALEADAVAQHLFDDGLGAAPVVQLYLSGDPRAEAAAASLRQQIVRRGGQVTDLVVSGSSTPTDTEWQALMKSAQGATAVLWLGRTKLDGLWAQWSSTPDDGPNRVYLSTSLYGTEPGAMPAGLRNRVYLVHPSALPSGLRRLLARSSGWMKAKRIEAADARQIQSNVFFALKAAGEATKRIRGFFNREFFIEGIEHMTENATYTSVYPGISLAPRQRFVSRGVYIAQFRPDGDGALVAVTDWLVPGSN